MKYLKTNNILKTLFVIVSILFSVETFFGQDYPQYEFKSTSVYNQKCVKSDTKESGNFYTINSSGKPGPKKVSGIGGWIDWLTWGQFHGVPSSASNEDMYSYYDYIQSGGTLSYEDWFNYKYSVPVGDVPVWFVIILCLIYIGFNTSKQFRQQLNQKMNLSVPKRE